MKKFTVTFDKVKIETKINSLVSAEERIDYLEFLLSVYREVYTLESDVDIWRFLSKYGLNKTHDDLYRFIYNNWKEDLGFDDIIGNLKYYSLKYKNFISEMIHLIHFSELQLSKYNKFKSILDDDSFLIFDRNALIHKMSTFKSNSEAYYWILKYIITLNDIIFSTGYNFQFDNFLIDKLYQEFELEEEFPAGDFDLPNKYDSFRQFLNKILQPFARNYLKDYELKVTIDYAKENYPDKFKSDSDKFPDFRFDYKRIKSYSIAVFRKNEEIAEYYLYILQKFNEILGYGDIIPNDALPTIRKIKIELENIKERIKLKPVTKTSESPPVIVDTSKIEEKLDALINKPADIIPVKRNITKTRPFTEAVNAYLEIALKKYDVPRQNELASKSLSESSWSRLFDDPLFLTALLKKIESKLQSKIIKLETKDVYIKLKLDIDSKISALYKKNSDAGQTNKKSQDFDDNRKIFDEDDD